MKRSGNTSIIILLSLSLVFISLIFVQAVNADEGGNKIYTLAESIREAFEKNWAIKEKEEKIEENGFVEKQAKAGLLPTFSTSYSYTRLGEKRTIKSPAFEGFPGGGGAAELEIGSQDNYQWKGSITQPLFTGFALTTSLELAKLGIDQSKMDLELEKLDLALGVKEAYFNILRADKGVGVAEKAVKSLRSHLEVATNFYEVGMIPINDMLKAEVELANAQHDLIKAQNASQLARASFNNLLAKPINSKVEIEDILIYGPENPDFRHYVNMALKNRPEIKTLEINSMQIDQQIKLAKSEYYPEIALTYDYIKEGDTPGVSGSLFHEPSTWQAILGFSWTVWDWGKTRSSVRQNESVKRQLVQTKKILEDGIRLEIKKAILGLQEAEKNIPTAKKAVQQAEENLRVSEERYKTHMTTSTEVLDAQTLLSQARMNYYNALYDHNLAKAMLLRAMGEY
jgi:outer membrane protein